MADQTAGRVYGYLVPHEIRFLDAATERLIPADDLGPGAKAAGVSVYIDRHLQSEWGTHGRNYRSGPWQEGTPQQGYQSRLTPQEMYRAAIRETELHCNATYGKNFDALTGAQQDEVLSAMEHNKIELPSVSSRVFFDLLMRNTEEGFFADPIYGGNQGNVGWKLLGFPGVSSGNYRDLLGSTDVYRAEPVSILDIQSGKVPVDSQGFPKHIPIKPV